MKITKIEIQKLFLPPPMPHRRATEELLIKIHTDEGITGFSECSGGGLYSGETPNAQMAVIKDLFAPVLIGEDPFNVEKIMTMIGPMLGPRSFLMVKGAIEFALYDIMGKALKMPCYRLLGGAWSKEIPLTWVLAMPDPKEAAKFAVSALEAGYKSIKVKVGTAWGSKGPEQDLERCIAVRDAIGKSTPMGIDSNQSLGNVDGACKLISRINSKCDIEYAEQPLPSWDIAGLAALRKRLEVPIYADESAFTLQELLACIKAEAVDGILIKVERTGYYMGKRIVATADAAGLSVIVGGMSGLGLQLAQNAHFIASTRKLFEVPWAFGCGTICQHFFKFSTADIPKDSDIAVPTPEIAKGILKVPEGPGLGVELNEKVVKKYAKEPPEVITEENVKKLM
ncbi:MAG: mandelate racemase/muconate lactonizing enzyme family protein [Candidatus Bathyarchaeia archaeon]